MNFILDILVIGAFIIGISTNAKRGLVKSLLLVFSYVISIWLSAYISTNYCDEFYGSYLEKSVEKKISEQTLKTDSAQIIKEQLFVKKLGIEVTVEEVREAVLEEGDLAENLSALAMAKNSGVDKSLVKGFISKEAFFENDKSGIIQIAVSNKDFAQAVRILAEENNEQRAEVFYREIGQTYAIKATKWIMTILLYMIISVLLGLLIHNINFIEKIPVARLLNTILGGVLGAVEGFVIIMIVALGIKIAVALLGFSDQAVYDTTFFKIFYDIFK